MRRIIIRLVSCMAILMLNPVWAALSVYQFDNDKQEAQYQSLINEFRCPKCQNQNLAGSDAPIAVDLKQRTYELVKQGQTDQEIRDYMISRYGDFISYKPPVRPSTWILWFLPFILLFLAILGWILRIKRSSVEETTTYPLSEQEEAQLHAILQQHTNQVSSEKMQ